VSSYFGRTQSRTTLRRVSLDDMLLRLGLRLHRQDLGYKTGALDTVLTGYAYFLRSAAFPPTGIVDVVASGSRDRIQ
jgi:hypothetical protein